MDVLFLPQTTQKQAIPAENKPTPSTERLVPGWTAVSLHWTDIDGVVDGILDALVDAMSYSRRDREAALDLEEAVSLNKQARLAQAAQDAAKPGT
jgi:hypothetical protein